MNTDNSLIRQYIRLTFANLLSEVEQPKYFIKYSQSKKIFILYKRFLDYDSDFNKVEKIIIVKDLDADPEMAKKMAKDVTGQDLEAKPPTEQKSNRGGLIMPFKSNNISYKGKQLKEIPLDYLVKFIFDLKWMSFIKANPYRLSIYEYLTQDLRHQTEEYLRKYVKGLSTPELMKKYNEYLLEANPFIPGAEKIVFASFITSILKKELTERRVQFGANGMVLIPK